MGVLLALLLSSSHHRTVAAATPTAVAHQQPAVVSRQCTLGTELSGSGTTANWPTYHFMNNVTQNASGALLLEPLNDANAIAEYKGKSLVAASACWLLCRHTPISA
jgi:hypothetical protein